MNYKLEKFWNILVLVILSVISAMNYKLEKFWNLIQKANNSHPKTWTINLKSFEIWTYSFFVASLYPHEL